MAIITKIGQAEHEINKRITGFFQSTKIGAILKKANAYKAKGIPVVQVMMYLVELAFTNRSMYMNILNGTNSAVFGKDVVYRFMKSVFINWSTYMLGLAMAVVKPLWESTGPERLCAIIFDDTMYERARSKKVELLARVCDHSDKGKQRFKKGFRLLTMGWTDGATFCPLMFRHLSSKEKKQRYNEANPDIDRRTVGYKARLQAMSKATDIVMHMLREAKKIGVPAKHVLFDSWFSYPSTMMAIKKLGYSVIARLKDTTKIKYLVNGTKMTLKEIYAANKKRPGRARYLLSTTVLLYDSEGGTLPARIVFVRERSKRKKWIAFVSTDMELDEGGILTLYGKRWDIEVFFKICKSYLKLGKEFQCLSYDSITAHTAVVMTRYVMLALDKRHSEDPRSLSQVFWHCCDEVADKDFAYVIDLILKALHEVLCENISLPESEISNLIDLFVDKISACFSRFFSKNKQIAALV